MNRHRWSSDSTRNRNSDGRGRAMDPRNPQRVRRRAAGAGLLAGLGVLGLVACDLEVTNPGPVQDDFLNEPAAQAAIVTGMNRAFNNAFNEIARRSASAVREVFPSGNTGRIGIGVREREGLFLWDDGSSDLRWTESQNARWVAEDGLRRFAEVLSEAEMSSSELVARAYLWAGYSNRLNGEHFCQAVIDGGSAVPHTEYLTRAEEHFTRAMQVGTAGGNTDIARAAQAGRASVRVHLGDWNGAVADAETVPTDFSFVTRFASTEEGEYNWWAWAVWASPYRVYTVWSTPFEEYYLETGDPRTRWGTHPNFEFGDQPIGDMGAVPFYVQRKITALDSPSRLSSGREMRLIEAEALLRAGSWQQAMDVINSLRVGLVSDDTGEQIPLWEASSLEEAWTHLKRERGIELWLEGRRLADVRRWDAENAPGEYHPLEVPETAVFLSPDRDLCWPVPKAEIDTNPNVSGPS